MMPLGPTGAGGSRFFGCGRCRWPSPVTAVSRSVCRDVRRDARSSRRLRDDGATVAELMAIRRVAGSTRSLRGRGRSRCDRLLAPGLHGRCRSGRWCEARSRPRSKRWCARWPAMFATRVAITTLAADAGGADGEFGRVTVSEYLTTLERLMVIEDEPAWAPHLRSTRQLRSSAKRHFGDPSLAVAALRAGPERLLQDLNFFGLLFESLVVRDCPRAVSTARRIGAALPRQQGSRGGCRRGTRRWPMGGVRDQARPGRHRSGRHVAVEVPPTSLTSTDAASLPCSVPSPPRVVAESTMTASR